MSIKGVAILVLGMLAVTFTVVAEVPESKELSPGPSNVGLAPEAAGGPDDFGYIFADNAETACSTLYNYVDITATGTAAGLAGVDDDYAGPLPIGFSFSFYGTAYTQFFVGTNGTLFFEDAYLGLANSCPLPATQSYTPQTFVALYHDDLVVQADGDIYYETFASCPVGNGGQCLVVQFYNVQAYSSSVANMDFEAVLFADGSVVLQYAQPSNDDAGQNNGGSSTVGIQGIDTTPPIWGVEYSCNSPSLSSGLAVAFAPPTAIVGGAPGVCAAQQPTPTATPQGATPVPTTSRTGAVLLMVLVAMAAFIVLRRRAV